MSIFEEEENLTPVERVQQAAFAKHEAEADWIEAILIAFARRRDTEDRYTVDDIASAAGLSRQRIYQLAKRAK